MVPVEYQKGRNDNCVIVTNQLTELEAEQADTQTRTVQPLQEKLETLMAENRALRDANDELTLKLEEVNTRQPAKKYENTFMIFYFF